MMYGKFNPDRFCKVLETIFSERYGSEVKVSFVDEEDLSEDEKKEVMQCLNQS